VTVANLMVLAIVKTVNAHNLNALRKMIAVKKRHAVRRVIVVRMENAPARTAQPLKKTALKSNVNNKVNVQKTRLNEMK
jgi:hypothetical protein